LAIIITTSTVVSRRFLVREALEKIGSSTELEAMRLNHWFEDQLQFIETLALDLAFNSDQDLTPQEIERLLASHFRIRKDLLALYLGLPNGTALFDKPVSIDFNIWNATTRPWYRSAQENPGKVQITPPYVDSNTGEMCITFSQAVYNSNGTLAGVLGSDVLLNTLQDIVRQSKVSEGATAFLIDGNGNILVHQDSQYNPTDQGSHRLNQIEDGRFTPLLAMNGLADEHSLIRFADGIYRYVQTRPVPVTNWRFYTTVPESVVTAATTTMLLLNVVTAAIVIIIALAVSYLVARAMNQLLQGASLDLTAATTNILTASDSLLYSSQALSDSSLHQASTIEETSAIMNGTADMVAQNNDHTRRMLELTNRTAGNVINGTEDITSLTDYIAQLSVSAAEISKIIDTIQSIAMQTTILALNASIEAARAGETGQAFAVVADEVRSLANQSNEALTHITSIINHNLEMTRLSTESSAKANLSFSTISQEIREIERLVSLIATASEEQALSITQINSAISQINSDTQNNAAISQESADHADTLQVQARTLSTLSERIKSLVGG